MPLCRARWRTRAPFVMWRERAIRCMPRLTLQPFPLLPGERFPDTVCDVVAGSAFTVGNAYAGAPPEDPAGARRAAPARIPRGACQSLRRPSRAPATDAHAHAPTAQARRPVRSASLLWHERRSQCSTWPTEMGTSLVEGTAVAAHQGQTPVRHFAGVLGAGWGAVGSKTGSATPPSIGHR